MKSKARLYQPAKTAMQSGKAKTRQWVLEFISDKNSQVYFIDVLMGWWSTTDTRHQVSLVFPSFKAAMEYGKQNHLDVEIISSPPARIYPKSYGEHFRFNRLQR